VLENFTEQEFQDIYMIFVSLRRQLGQILSWTIDSSADLPY